MTDIIDYKKIIFKTIISNDSINVPLLLKELSLGSLNDLREMAVNNRKDILKEFYPIYLDNNNQKKRIQENRKNIFQEKENFEKMENQIREESGSWWNSFKRIFGFKNKDSAMANYYSSRKNDKTRELIEGTAEINELNYKLLDITIQKETWVGKLDSIIPIIHERVFQLCSNPILVFKCSLNERLFFKRKIQKAYILTKGSLEVYFLKEYKNHENKHIESYSINNQRNKPLLPDAQ
jgi:hypothetical protein